MWIALFATVALAAGRHHHRDADQKPPEEFGHKGSFVFGGERLASVVGWQHEVAEASSARATSVIDFGIASPSTTLVGFASPRLSLDGFVRKNLSIGGGLSVGHGMSTVGEATSNTTGLLVAPRAGYLFPFSKSVAFWPRLGVTFDGAWGDGGTRDTLFAGGAEALFAITPVRHATITLGPVADFTFTADEHTAGGDAGYHASYIGLSLGMLGWL